MLKRTLVILGSLLVVVGIGTGCQPHEIHWYLHEATPEQREAVDAGIREDTASNEARWYATLAQRRAIQLHPYLVCVRHHESDRGPYPHTNGYYIGNSHGQSTSSGAYQFVDGTWRSASAQAGYPGYAKAMHAPDWIQDAVAHHLATTGGRSAWNGTGC